MKEYFTKGFKIHTLLLLFLFMNYGSLCAQTLSDSSMKTSLPQGSMIQQRRLFQDSINRTRAVILRQYQKQADSILNSIQLDGRQKWEKMNMLARDRNVRLQQVNEKIRRQSFVQEIKQ